MFISDISSGLMIGLPIMITLGPISILLLNQGMDRGARTALPGALGVASADMTYSSLAALAGTALVAALTPIAPALRAVGIAVLIWMAWTMARDSRREVAALRRSSSAQDPSGQDPSAPGSFGIGAGGSAAPGMATALCGTPAEVEQTSVAAARGPLAHLGGARLAGAFYGLTLMNPMTIVLMSAVVIAGGPGVGTAGWAAGMTLSSLIAHGGYVLTGSFLRRTCSEMTLARMGTVSATVLVVLSVHLALT